MCAFTDFGCLSDVSNGLMSIFRITIFLTAFIFLLSCGKKVTDEKTSITVESRIHDQADLLTPDQEENIFQLIKEVDKKLGSQIAILTIDTLIGEPINEFSLRTANQIKLGREKYNDGILLTIAVKNREMRIEVGIGLEKIIKDEIASQIIQDDIAPHFREKDYYTGIKNGVEKIKKLIEDHPDLIGQTK